MPENARDPRKQRELFDEVIEAVTKSHAEWKLGLLVSIFLAFATGVLKWNSYSDAPLEFSRGHGWLSLFGLWLLCYWGVRLAAMFWRQRS